MRAPASGSSVKRRQRARIIQAVLYSVFAIGLILVVVVPPWPRIQQGFANVAVASDMWPEVITVGAKNTVLYTATSFVFGLALGLFLALMKLSTIGPYRWLATWYIELFRALPALVTITLIGFGIPIMFNISFPYLWRATIGLGLVAAAYMAETIRAGIEAVPKGQMEAARSLGMTRSRAMASIVLPQAFRIIIPPLTNEAVLLIKDTSLLFVLGFTPLTKELYKFGRDVMTARFNGTPLTVIAIVYVAITLPLTRLVAQLEKRAARAR